MGAPQIPDPDAAADFDDGLDPVAEMKAQRDQALACAWLSVTLAIAVLISTFSDHRAALAGIQRATADEQKQLAAERAVLTANETAEAQTQRALAQVKK